MTAGRSPIENRPCSDDNPVTFATADQLANDADVDSATLSIASVTSGGGTAVLNPDAQAARPSVMAGGCGGRGACAAEFYPRRVWGACGLTASRVDLAAHRLVETQYELANFPEPVLPTMTKNLFLCFVKIRTNLRD